MKSDSLVADLRRVALFAGLTAEQLAAVAAAAERVSFKTGEEIIAENAAGDAAYFILSGEAVCTSGTQAAAEGEAVGAQTLIGEMAMLIDAEHRSTVTCLGPVLALRFRREAMHALMTADSSVAEHFVGEIARRLEAVAASLRQADRAIADAPRHFSPPALSAPARAPTRAPGR
jgi:CRP-like cAMP-binding protein